MSGPRREQMKAITVEPKPPGTARREDVPEPDLRVGHTFRFCSRTLSRQPDL
jgi:hypothetical protein